MLDRLRPTRVTHDGSIHINHLQTDEVSIARAYKELKEPTNPPNFTIQVTFPDGQKSQYNLQNALIKNSFCSFFTDIDNLDTKIFLINTSQFMINEKCEIMNNFFHYAYCGHIKIPNAHVLNYIQIALKFQCKQLLTEIYEEMSLKNFTPLNSAQSIDFLAKHCQKSQLLVYLGAEKLEVLLKEVVLKNFDSFMSQNKDYIMNPTIFNLILTRLLKAFPSQLQVHHTFFVNVVRVNGQNKEIVNNYYQATKHLYDRQEKVKQFSQCLEQNQLLDLLYSIHSALKQQAEKLEGQRSGLEIRVEQMNRAENIQKQYNLCFHLARSTECDELQVFINPECGHRVCAKCFIEYFIYKTNKDLKSESNIQKYRLRCLSRYTEVSICDKVYNDKDKHSYLTLNELTQSQMGG